MNVMCHTGYVLGAQQCYFDTFIDCNVITDVAILLHYTIITQERFFF